MAEKERMVFYIDKQYAQFLQRTGNISKYVRTLIEADINKMSTFKKQLSDAEIKEKDLQLQLVEVQEEIKFLKDAIRAQEELEKYRPPEYDDIVKMFTHDIKNVTPKHIVDKARALGIPAERLKRWLIEDGVYTKMFS